MTAARVLRAAFAAACVAIALTGCGGGVDTRQTAAVVDPAAAPTISGSPSTVATVGQAYAFTPSASDPSGRALTFSITNQPSWASFNTGTGALAGTPGAGNVGSTGAIVISVSNGSTSASLPSFSITVQSVGSTGTPTISGTPPGSVVAGQAYSFTPTASDPAGAALTFSITNRPAWASFDPATGTLSGTPTSTNVGTYSNILITVSNGTRTASLAAFGITVSAPARIGSVTLSWVPPTQRTDGTVLTSLAGYRVYFGTRSGTYPNQVTITNPGVASYVVDSVPSGTYFFVLTAYDASGNESNFSNEASATVP